MHHRRLGSIVLAAAALGLAAGCGGDDGADVRQVGGETGSTASGTGSATASGSGTATGAATQVPDGVAAQYAQIEEEIEAEGGETTSGPWRVGYIVEGAEGWYEPRGGRLVWRAPAAGETHHVEILPIEAATGRVVPDVPITVEILDEGGDVVATKQLSFYYATFFHYAENFSLEPGEYTLRATLGAPAFRRHGEQDEPPALSEGVTVTFEDVEIEGS
jgi:hypothetical protein